MGDMLFQLHRKIDEQQIPRAKQPREE